MSYKTGTWGEQAKKRSKQRLGYFKQKQKEKRKRMGLSINDSIGKIGEKKALLILKDSKFIGKKIDLEWNNMSCPFTFIRSFP